MPAGLLAQTITRGPFLQQLGTDGVIVVWETDGSTDGRVEYGLDQSYGQTAIDSAGEHHEVVLSGMAPATTYHYKVFFAGAESPDGMFATAPVEDQPFRSSGTRYSRSYLPCRWCRAWVSRTTTSFASLRATSS